MTRRECAAAALILAVSLCLAVWCGTSSAAECPADSYAIALDFDAGDLTGDRAVWAARTHDAMADGNNWDVIYGDASAADTYEMSRAVHRVVSSLLHALRATGDRAYLDSCVVLTDVMADSLKDETADGSDGYLGWWWKPADATYQNRDIHWDEVLLYSFLAEYTWALTVNAGVDTVYASRAAFWTDHLFNDFQAKWIERSGGSNPLAPTDAELDDLWHTEHTGAATGLRKTLWHPMACEARLHYFMYLLSGNDWYLNEVAAIELLWNADRDLFGVGAGERYGWPHDQGTDPTTDDDGYQKMEYVEYTWYGLSPLISLDVFDNSNAARYAAAFAAVFALGTSSQMGERINADAGDPVVSLVPDGAGSAARWGSYAAIVAACGTAYDVTQSRSVSMAGHMTWGASE